MAGEYDTLILTNTPGEAETLNAGNGPNILAIPFGSLLVHGKRYKTLEIAYEDGKLAYSPEQISGYLSFIKQYRSCTF